MNEVNKEIQEEQIKTDEQKFEEYLLQTFDSKKLRSFYKSQKEKEEGVKKYLQLKKLILRGRGSRPLLQSDIERALNNSQSNAGAARYLGVSDKTFQKYALMYCPEKYYAHRNQRGLGIIKLNIKEGGLYSLEDIFKGKYKNYDTKKLKERLILTGYLEDKCNLCGFDERRVTDYSIPLELDFIDGNKHNFNIENLRLLCYNCYYLNCGDKFLKLKNRM